MKNTAANHPNNSPKPTKLIPHINSHAFLFMMSFYAIFILFFGIIIEGGLRLCVAFYAVLCETLIHDT